MTTLKQEQTGLVRQGDLEAMRTDLIASLQNGEILIPQVVAGQSNFAGGVNHCPDSDFSYSKDAATVPGTLPATAGDGNQEAYRAYRQQLGVNMTVDDVHALKAVGHSLFAANENATPAIPRWDRVNGWLEIGASGATQYDVSIQLLNKIVSPGQHWYVRFLCAALNAAVVPANVQAFVGIWQKGTTEGWVQGDPFNLSSQIYGIPGGTSIDYRVLAKTDSGVSILSNVLNVPDAPNVLSANNYIKIFYSAGAGFIEFQVFKKVGAVYSRVHTVRNSTDLQFNDIGTTGTPETGWPADPGNAPRAYAETRNINIGAFGSAWRENELTISVPSTYNFSLTNSDGQFLRLGLTNPTGVNRHIGIDRIWFSTTFNKWAPDDIRLSDGTSPVPSVSPTSGNQGSGTGLGEPPEPGGDRDPRCILTRLPVLVCRKKQLLFRPFSSTRMDDGIKGEQRLPYIPLRKKVGTAAEYYVIKTKNGITYECNGDHRITIDTDRHRHVQAKHIEIGLKLPCWVKGRRTYTTVVSVALVPEPAEVGTFTLRDPSGLRRDGEGIFIAGKSKNTDRGLYSSNAKSLDL